MPGGRHGHAQHGPGGALGQRRGTYAIAAQALCPALVILGLSVPENDTVLWSTTTAWAIFAAIASVVQLAPALGRSGHRSPEQLWTIGAVATAALVGWWVVLVLPGVSSNVGFLLTMGVAAAVIGSWLSPGRRV